MGAARYRSYPAYKPSGVEWLGNVPEGWEGIQVGRLFRRSKRTDHVEKQLLSVYRDHGVIPKASRDDNNNKASEDLSPYQLVEEHDLVLNKMKTWQGSIAISEHEGIVSPAYFVYQPESKLFEVAEPKYVHFLLRNPMYIAQYLRRSKGIRVNQWDLDPGEFQKIELLRPSGIDWLGDVPEHWEVKKFSHCTSIRSGQVDPRKLPYSEYTLIAPNHIESGTGRILSMETAAEQGADSGKYLCAAGEVIYSKIRPALAKACLAPHDDTICSADMYPISGTEGLSNKFLFWNLLSQWFTSLTILESDRVAMPKINREKLAEVSLPVPPIGEQDRICDFIEKQTSILDTLVAKAQSAITLLKERRTALISAAVTGKIDVRDWQPPKPISTIASSLSKDEFA